MVQVTQRREALPCLDQGSAHTLSVTTLIRVVTKTGVTPVGWQILNPSPTA